MVATDTKPSTVKQFKKTVMDKKSLREHLVFFKQNIVDLNNPNIYVEIEKYFDQTEFFKNFDFFFFFTLIFEDDKIVSLFSITEKGNKVLSDILKELEYEAEKERIEFEKSKTDLVLAQKMLKEFPKTKMFSRISLFIAIVLALKELYILIKPIL